MALPSQVERTNETNRGVMTRGGGRGKGPNKVMVGAAALVLVAGLSWGLWKYMPKDATGPQQATAKEPAKQTPPPRSLAPDVPANVPATPTGVNSLAHNPPVPPADAPVVLTQGRSGGIQDPTKPRPVDVTGGNTTGPGTSPLTGPGNPQNPGSGPANLSPGSSNPALVPTLNPSTSAAGVRQHIEAGDRAFAANNLVQARVSYSRALMSADIGAADAQVLRSKLETINEDLVFSPKIAAGDPLVETYTVVANDSLEKIRKKRDLAVDHRLLARVNRLSNPNAIRVGQKLKLVRGPFNAVVHKADYRLDLYAGSPDDQESWVFIRSFKVGLGENNGTPLGNFVIKKNSKLINPHWVNPKTGEKFDANDPKNPIGEFWLGWEGLGDSKVYTGFGLHGTIDPSSIGAAKSMGCVRMADQDIALIYELLVEQISRVQVLPN
ncbi:MAG TPA: L,D-transpeptidase family protein [Phycisphaerales bacterium]|nr:L,D-transpeptidase family protein [Phycisphaerales bacterium]